VPSGTLTHDFTLVCLDYCGGIGFKRVTESVIGSQEKPFFSALFDHGATGYIGQRLGIVGIMNGVRGAVGIGQRRAAWADRNIRDFLVGGNSGRRKRGSRIGAADNHIYLVLVNPLPDPGGSHVGLVLVVGSEQFDFFAVDRAAGLFDGHFDRFHTALAVDIGIHARHIGNETDTDDVIRNARSHGLGAQRSQSKRTKFFCESHRYSPIDMINCC
jgi:hypothetical protein